MPKVEMELGLEELARIIKALTTGELETLAILIDDKLTRELLERADQVGRELKEGKLLSMGELFEILLNIDEQDRQDILFILSIHVKFFARLKRRV